MPASPGRSGFGPALDLSYDSGAGNGPFGLGFQLSVPMVSRKTDKGLPRYLDADDTDEFTLAGAEDLVDGEDTQKHLATLKKLGQRLLVERDAIAPDAGWNLLGIPVDPLDRARLADLMAESRRVLVF